MSGSLQISQRHYKDGDQSLAWNWERGGYLRCTGIRLVPQQHPRAGVKMWVYNEEPIDGNLVIELGSEQQIQADRASYVFQFHLDFTGWRACWLLLKENEREAEKQGEVETMRLRAPDGADRGGLYLDAIEFVDAMPNRSADYQMPEFTGEPGGWWQHQPLLDSREEPRRPLPETVTEEDRHDLSAIAERYETWLLGAAGGEVGELPDPMIRQVRQYIDRGWENYEELGLTVDDDGIITGPGLAMGRETGTFFHVFYNIMLPLAFDYAYDGAEKSREALLRLFDYVHDQGWAEGSANGSLALNGLQFAAYCHSLYLMRDALDETGRLRTHLDAAWWYLSFGKAFRAHPVRDRSPRRGRLRQEDSGCTDGDGVTETGSVKDRPRRGGRSRTGGNWEYQETNADELRSTLFTSLPVILAMEESPRQVQYLRSWRDWFHSALEIAPRFAGVFKPDGTGWHHRGVYAGAYTGSAYEFAALAMYLISDTSYHAETWAVANLARALRTQFIMSHGYSLPHAVRGRMLGNEKYATEQPEWYGICVPYAYLAMTGDAAAEDMSGLFMRLWDPGCDLHEETLCVGLHNNFLCKATPGRRVLLEEFAAQGHAPASHREGFWMKPWAGLALARQDNWMAAIKGWSQYVWDFECHPGMWATVEQNVYSRFISNGSIQILATGKEGTPAALGCCLDRGWDWTRWPGTTAKNLTLEEMYSPTETWQTRWFSDETFVGGVEADKGEGVFAIKLHDTCHDPSFRATKSYFVFGNQIICLGSNIRCNDPDHAIETTLFQCYMPDEEMPVKLNGAVVTDFPYEHRSAGESLTALDPYDNGYVVPESQDARLVRQKQTSRTANNEGPTEGCYSTGWIDHGEAPTGGGYEYAMLVQSSVAELGEFAAAPPYRVLQKDEHAHVLEHTERSVTAYAIFSADRELDHGPVARTDVPVVVMVRRETSQETTLHLADPNLRLPQRGNMGFLTADDVKVVRERQTVRLHLRGQWEVVASDPSVRMQKYDDQQMLLAADCADGLTVTARLRRKDHV